MLACEVWECKNATKQKTVTRLGTEKTTRLGSRCVLHTVAVKDARVGLDSERMRPLNRCACERVGWQWMVYTLSQTIRNKCSHYQPYSKESKRLDPRGYSLEIGRMRLQFV